MKFTVAVVQQSSVFFDKEACLEKLEKTVKICAEKGCRAVLFPETFIPGYPRGFTFGMPVGKRSEAGRELWAAYRRESVQIGDSVFVRMENLARKYKLYLIVGLTEKDRTNGSLYCSMFYFSPTAGFMGSHRKLKPTGAERLIWADGSADSLLSFRTEIGRMSGLICWENYMPEARTALYSQGLDLYFAPTADARPTWAASMQHIACESRAFVFSANQFFRKEDYPEKYREFCETDDEILSAGGSLIVAPSGEILAGPLWNEEGILTAEIDLAECEKYKLDFDVIGHYARPDIFRSEAAGMPKMREEKAC